MPADRLLHPKLGHSEKVNLLTSDEYRTWTQYMLSADDFGVMRASAVTLQADNDYLASKPAKAVQRWLDTVVKSGLIRDFEHQTRRYVFQHDWQTWQKIEYPRATNNPLPGDGILKLCNAATRALFEKHPGGQRKATRPKDDPNNSEHASQIHSVDVPPTRAAAPAKRLTANGKRQTANGSEGGGEEETVAPLFEWFSELKAAYPEQAVSSGYGTESAFVTAVLSHGTPDVTFTVMLANLQTQKRGAQWLSGKIPRLDRWLSGGLWEQRHDGPVVSDRTAGTLAAAADIMREDS